MGVVSLSPEQQQQVVALAMDLARDGEAPALREFLDHGLPVDVQNEAGDTLLMLAAYHGHADTVAMLVERGADVDLCNGRGQCPLAGAIFKGERAVVQVLLGAGADLDVGAPTPRQAAQLFGMALG